MKSLLRISFLGLVLITTALPASAGQVTGPRGSTASGNGAVIKNPQGGYVGA
ncbi:MAG: hypothetical protein HC908_04520, partial [Calothrix sp. SM1_7_51]|nr:hypothetical protein [Calothrix sp. SM1_7_51]